MTTGKTELPSIAGELAPRRRVDLKAIRPASIDDDAIERNSRALGSEWGASTSLASPEKTTPLASLRIVVPDYLDRALARDAAEQRVTKQYLVMKALRAAGYHIAESDLVEDKRKAKKRKV